MTAAWRLDFTAEDHPLDTLLEAARMAAASEWEEDFVAKMQDQRWRFGLNWEPSAAQHAKLAQIAGEAELGDGYDA